MGVFDKYDNFIIVPVDEETPEEVILHYAILAADCDDISEMEMLMTGFFNEISLMVEKRFTIQGSLQNIERIKEIQTEIEMYRDYGAEKDDEED
ncbi:hypothetical protein [Aquibacillus saliphilus]|uniref:hypothetical protein n=1 Tax=Aquibacillus saliphilus TaxID=1909422 RepID=UPI001CF03774|nr:hypothetical protein [Aquibacillus saliphilus]